MDVEFARSWLSRIGAVAGNAEAAHGEEDDFRGAMVRLTYRPILTAYGIE